MAEDRKNDEERSFLGRWSRRKREAAQAEVTAEPETESAATAKSASSEDREALERAEIEKANREAAEAVDVDSLTYESDFSIFLKAGVPAILKQKAMRKLWTSNPVLANLDGLNDYDEDYNNPAHNVFKSVWQAGKGYLVSDADKPESDEKIATQEDPSEDESAAETAAENLMDTAEAPVDSGEDVDETAEGSAEEAPEPRRQEEAVRRVSIRDRLKG